MHPLAKYYFITFYAFISSCSLNPQPIHYGYDQCSFCKMTITDSRYGTELISKKGKIYKFDSIECLIHFAFSEEISRANIHQLLITDFVTPENFTDVETAHYLISENLPSPMGANLTGFQSMTDAEKFRSGYDGKILTWSEAIQKIQGEIN